MAQREKEILKTQISTLEFFITKAKKAIDTNDIIEIASRARSIFNVSTEIMTIASNLAYLEKGHRDESNNIYGIYVLWRLAV